MKTLPSDAELEILRVLWTTGPATVRDVYSRLPRRADVVYNTVGKLLRIMEEKGFVACDDSARAHVFRPLVRRERVCSDLVRDLADRAFRSAEARRRLVRLAADAAAPGSELDTAAGSVDSGGHGGRIVIRGTGGALVIRVDEVDWMEAVRSYVRVHAGELSKLVRTSLTALERQLDPARFSRIHRSSIVNLDRVREVEPLGHGDALVRLVDGTELRVSRSRRETFVQALEA